ncbi:hypothetical protein F6W79_14580 [Vibrio diabolicus]|uniref:hypothetical protein n=1 Tax=Vibrio diabolicus TaxID=50719 RepID=UPI0012491608|nr:hypothetical protein [Vibrio diabolicus]KAB0316292.1 hypothetical protein F6W79_14580 [Vibrio diabolicus]
MEPFNGVTQGSRQYLTVVGDDWQAIYAFTGGKLEYTTDFQEKVGNHALTKLQKTFRYNNSIADTAGAFIMKNDKQHKKHINTHTNVTEPEVYLMDNQDDKEKDPVQATLNAVEREIHKIKKDDPKHQLPSYRDTTKLKMQLRKSLNQNLVLRT